MCDECEEYVGLTKQKDSGWLEKMLAQHHTEHVAREMLLAFIRGEVEEEALLVAARYARELHKR